MIADRLTMTIMSRQEFHRGEPAVALFCVNEDNSVRLDLKIPQRLGAEAEMARRGAKLRVTIEVIDPAE